MRTGFVLSSGAHAAIIAWATFNFFSPKPFDVGPSESLPVELISPTEFDQLTKGSRTSKIVEKPVIRAIKLADADPEDTPELKEAKQEVKPAPPPPAEPPKPEVAKVEPDPIPVPKPVEKVEPPKPEKVKAPEPKPEPPKEAAKPPEPKPPEPKPEPAVAKAEPKPEPKPEPEKKPDPKPEPPKEAAKPPEPKPEPKPPEKKPPPPKPAVAQPKPPERSFDSNKIAALLDKREPVRTASAGREIAAASTAGIPRGTATRLSLSERSAIGEKLRQQITPCWNPPIGAQGADKIRVVVRFQLNADGTLAGQPSVAEWGTAAGFQAAADSALRAVRRCSPVTLPSESYDFWKDVEINFDPRDMLGG
jgi:colicin import membrane protein